jgi:peroxiredoxin
MSLEIGQEAPNFDLTSTEDALLMLRDEVARTAVLLYFCPAPDADGVRADLTALAAARDRLAAKRLRILAVSRAPLAALAAAQRELRLPFPLLHDDRDFSTRYGVAPPAEGAPAPRALFLVGRDQRLLWLACPTAGVAADLPRLEAALATPGTPLRAYPRKVLNRFIDRSVN